MIQVFLQAEGNPLTSFLPLALVLVVMYLFFFRPQIKKQKEEKKFREEISKGMRVVTNSGIHGKILEMQENTLIIESENSRLKIDKAAVSKEFSATYLPKEEKSSKKEETKSDK
jgi:preprotein translocase subunit YajC